MRLIALAIAIAVAVSSHSVADEFRVETKFFIGEETVPLAETLTLFSDGPIYDFQLGQADQITVYDLQRNRFVLLNVKQRVKTTLETQGVLTAVSNFKASIPQANKLFHFAANPEFKRTADEDMLTLKLDSISLRYDVVGTPPRDRTAVRRYQDFADWSARINSMQSDRHLPPFARMEVDKQLAELGWVPARVERTTHHKNGLFTKNIVAHTEHKYNWTLSTTDRRRIEKVGEYMATFAELSYTEFKGANRIAKQPANAK